MHKICIIIPCYNEQRRLPQDEFLEFYQGSTYSFCFVNDGSQDATLQVLHNLQKSREERVLVVDLPQNLGKAEAVRIGILHALEWGEFDWVGYFDADFSTPLSEAAYLLDHINSNTLLVLGSRVNRLGATIERNFWRHYFGRVFSTFASLTLKLPVYDSQCGAKFIHTHVAQPVFATPFLTRWLFDLEIVARMINLLGRRAVQASVVEIPLNKWIRKDDSRLLLGHMIKVPFDLLKVYWHYKLDQPKPEPSFPTIQQAHTRTNTTP